MVPKIIHYCWFGAGSKSNKIIECINSWEKFLPDYQLIEWNENNFDIHCCPYVEEAYNEHKWAFVAYYARLKILYEYGGIYLDTDVEIIKDLQTLVDHGNFMGVENNNGVDCPLINPGLIMCAEKGAKYVKDIMDTYENEHFVINGKNTSKFTIVARTTEILKTRYNLKKDVNIQYLDNLIIYPKQYFCPLDYRSGELQITRETYCIHWYAASWLTKKQKQRQTKSTKIYRLFPNKIAELIYKIYFKLGAISDIYEDQGFKGILDRIGIRK